MVENGNEVGNLGTGRGRSVEERAQKRDNEESARGLCVGACVRTVKQERVDGLIGAKRDKVQSTLEGKGDERRFVRTY